MNVLRAYIRVTDLVCIVILVSDVWLHEIKLWSGRTTAVSE